jgi:hypothetical protein
MIDNKKNDRSSRFVGTMDDFEIIEEDEKEQHQENALPSSPPKNPKDSTRGNQPHPL